MKFKGLTILLIALFAFAPEADEWLSVSAPNYTLYFKPADQANKKEYQELVDAGISAVQVFFNDSYKNKFNIYIHPNRKSLEEQWQKDWSMPEFKSECWMVASGVGSKLDMISPKVWDKEACEHTYSDHLKTQQLITHELFHVYHGQQNPSPDFSEVTDMDWFVEGFATYASGQCDAGRIQEIKKALFNNTLPVTLNDFWKGKMKYGLSGSVVMYIDKKYGRPKLKELLPFGKKEEVLKSLGVSESDLLAGWGKFIESSVE